MYFLPVLRLIISISGTPFLETDRTKWFQLLATPPVRSVVEGALLLPQEFGLIDIDWPRRMVTLSLADATGAPAQAIEVSFAELQISD